ncbi:DeoR family transcriptional regulator [Streptomyces sp. NBC_00986]|uniref:DeoR family transcriptional regulator n=1 Tax=Streptomyces sp. NBC_00986 TaxID=2903702 RepID=UPI003866B38D|nr:DeoR family transcriptional regulator [Streptomyces sp. NBC_00986]
MTRGDRRTLVHKLRDEEGLSQRQIARRLNISKDTVRRDLEIAPEAAPDDAPPAEPDTPLAPQAGEGDAAERAPGHEPDDAPDARAALPRRFLADPLAGIDVSQARALRRDLAVLAQSGMSAEAVVHLAVVCLAHQYGKELAAGRIRPGQRFVVRSMDLRPSGSPPPPVVAAAGPPTAAT